MTATEMTKNVGKKGIVNLNGLNVVVKILDCKISYGVMRYLITPDQGLEIIGNTKWSDSYTVKIND
jgi:hypothetical protein